MLPNTPTITTGTTTTRLTIGVSAIRTDVGGIGDIRDCGVTTTTIHIIRGTIRRGIIIGTIIHTAGEADITINLLPTTREPEV
jgi:hypothetical protein